MRMPSLTLALVLAGSSLSYANSQDWTATSTTSLAITGDITVSADRITFENGASIAIRAVSPDRPGIYRVDPPGNPVLKNGNRLCGDDAPTFIALGRHQNSASLEQSTWLHLKVFEGREIPAAAAAVGMGLGGVGLCAILNYERSGAAADTRDAAEAGPSFDCKRAQTQVERAICSSPQLSRLDAALARAYRDRTAALSESAADEVLQRQRGWLASRNRCGTNAACLERSYRNRIAVLGGRLLSADSRGGQADVAAASASPEQTVREIYASMGRPESQQRMASMQAPDQRARYFTPELVAFFDANDSYGDDSSRACIDFAMIVAGNESDEIEIARTLAIRSKVEDDYAVVDARFTNFGEQNHFRYEFVRNGEHWKIADIASLKNFAWRLSDIPCEPAKE